MLKYVQKVSKLSIFYHLAVSAVQNTFPRSESIKISANKFIIMELPYPALVVFGDEVSIGVSQVSSSEKWVKSKA